MPTLKHRAVLAVLSALTGLVGWIGIAAAELPQFAGRTTLVMVDDINCYYCRKWEREVGPSYGRSREGQMAPLLKIRRGDPRLAGIGGLAYTPTFIVVANGREVGRIVGYGGADFFWGEIEQIFNRAGIQATPPPAEIRADLAGRRARAAADRR